MMAFSIDTNIAIGVLNPSDRLHTRSISLLRGKTKKTKLVLFACVLVETEATFARKYGKAFAEIYRIVQKLNKKRLNKLEFDVQFSKEITGLVARKRNLRGFIELIYRQFKPFIDCGNIQGGFSSISHIGIVHLALIRRIITLEANDNIICNDFSSTDLQHFINITKLVGGVYFKDKGDEDIFISAFTYSFCKDIDLVLYTDDTVFIKESLKARIQIEKDSSYKTHKFEMCHLP